jgi:hypothetical protein
MSYTLVKTFDLTHGGINQCNFETMFLAPNVQRARIAPVAERAVRLFAFGVGVGVGVLSQVVQVDQATG